MTFPVLEDITGTSFGSADTSHLVAMPAAVNAGDLLIILFGQQTPPSAVGTPGGWFRVSHVPQNAVSCATFWRLADGTEGGMTVDVTTSSGNKAVAQVYRVSGWYAVADFAAASGGESNGEGYGLRILNDATAFPDPYLLNPSRWGVEDTLWIAAYFADGREAVVAYPAGFTDLMFTESDAGASAVSMASAHELETVSQLNPSTFEIAASRDWVAVLIAVRPAPGDSGERGYQLGAEKAQRWPWDAEESV